ncbi:MAG: hypothetical protein N2C14_12025, partial [Planctomycetales bacterium]
ARVVNANSDAALESLAGELTRVTGQQEAAIKFMVAAFILKALERARASAETTFADIARTREIQGFSLVVEPKAADIQRAIDRIDREISDAFETLAGVRTGRVGTEELEQNSNAITQTYYTIVGAAAAKFKDKPTVKGFARLRDSNGREVAQKRVIVSEDELRRLRSTLDAIRSKFQARVRKADRQDVSEILEELQSIAAQTVAGQKNFDADVNLKQVITDLPLRTAALDTTPRNIAVMTSSAFKDWLARLDVAVTRADELLSGPNWLVLSPLAENEKFTFLRLNELP